MHSVRRCCSSIPTRFAWSVRPGFRGASVRSIACCGKGSVGPERRAAAVLALQVLGGDPEDAYLTAVCGAGYAVVLAIRARLVRSGCTSGRSRSERWSSGLGPRSAWQPPGWLGRGRGDERSRLGDLAALGTRAGVALAAPSGRGPAGSAARQADGCLRLWRWPWRPSQVLPVLEFSSQSWRAAGVAVTNRLPLQPAPLPDRRVDLAERVRDERPRASAAGSRLCRLWETRRSGWNRFTWEVWHWFWLSVPVAFATARPGASGSRPWRSWALWRASASTAVRSGGRDGDQFASALGTA